MMDQVLTRLSQLITSRPWITLGLLLIVTVVLAVGMTRCGEISETEGFFPPDSPIVQAIDEIEELFQTSGQVSVTTLVFRGDALTPDGLAQIEALTERIIGEAPVQELLLDVDSVVSPAGVLRGVLPAGSLDSVSQAAIDEAAAAPALRPLLDALTGTDADGTSVAIATIRLRDTGDERSEAVDRLVHELALEHAGALDVRSISPTIIEDEYHKATQDGIGPLIGAALVVIALLVLVFMRSISDLLLSLAGLLISLIWVLGAEGWLGPNGLGLIGQPSGISVMIPIIVISLTVDYAIQAVSEYREQRAADAPPLDAVRGGLRQSLVPLFLAAATTVISFLVALISPIPAIVDFGILAAVGVGMSLIVMLTLIPCGRVLLDRRSEARGELAQPRLVSEALPGIGRAVEALGRSVTRRPAIYLIVLTAASIALGIASTGIEARFSIRDILPRGGEVLGDLDTVEAAVGGTTQLVNVLIRAEATETRTLLNLQDLRLAFEDEQRRPSAAIGPLERSFDSLLYDWIEDSGETDARYDADLARLFDDATTRLGVDPQGMQRFLDRLARVDPDVASYLSNDSSGIDTILVQFPAYSIDPDLTKQIQDEIETLWRGDDAQLTAASESIVSVAVTDEITSRQTESIVTTIVVALAMLAGFYWVTLRQPVLSVIAVAPIGLALVWVLGTMALLDIPYTLVTSMITALSIGIGVDYSIHVIHRYREEFTRLRNPEQAAVRTLATTGASLLGSALTTAVGLGMLVFSPAVTLQQFGITAAFTIVYALIAATVLVPPMMTIWGAYQNMRLRSNLERIWAELDDTLEGRAAEEGA